MVRQSNVPRGRGNNLPRGNFGFRGRGRGSSFPGRGRGTLFPVRGRGGIFPNRGGIVKPPPLMGRPMPPPPTMRRSFMPPNEFDFDFDLNLGPQRPVPERMERFPHPPFYGGPRMGGPMRGGRGFPCPLPQRGPLLMGPPRGRGRAILPHPHQDIFRPRPPMPMMGPLSRGRGMLRGTFRGRGRGGLVPGPTFAVKNARGGKVKVKGKISPDTASPTGDLNKPWVTEAMKNEILKKHKLHTKAKKGRNKEDWEVFKEQRNKVTTMLREAKLEYIGTHPDEDIDKILAEAGNSEVNDDQNIVSDEPPLNAEIKAEVMEDNVRHFERGVDLWKSMIDTEMGKNANSDDEDEFCKDDTTSAFLFDS